MNPRRMRFEELSYRADGLPVTVPFHPRLTVVGPLGGRARAEWIERVLGVLLGSRRGDGVSVVLENHSGARVRLERDRYGAATIIDLSTGDDLTPAAGHLPLDGRFDWFASLGLDPASARALLRLLPSDFKVDDVDPWEAEDALLEARGQLARVEAEYGSVTAGPASERAATTAILAAGEAGEEWQQAADSLEVAHRAVEEAERELDRATVPALAVAARRRLTRARQREQSVLDRMGFVSWLAFQMHRVDVLRAQPADVAPEVEALEERSVTDPGDADVGRLEDRRQKLTHRIASLEAAARAGYRLQSAEDAEMVLLGRIARVRRVGPRAEPLPLLVDDALAGFEPEARYNLLHLLARPTEITQVVYLTGDPDTLEWASARARSGETLVVPSPMITSVA